ncbi:MAG TPA: sigma 54-interacting transcriptional regulator, partial [Burkholderiales bacterium]
MQKLLNTVGRVLKRGTVQPQQQLSLASLGKSPQIAELKKRMEQIANLNLPLLLVGEVGCGVELCARFLHQPNTQWSIPENYAQLVDAPLDLLHQAHDGLLFLSEIGELSKQEQKGLILLVSKLGKYNVRLVCATSKALPELVSQGQFDASLYQVLSVLTLGVPSLREHREDIPDLARLMLSRCVEAAEAPLREFSTSALNALRNYSWPGNLIQLENAVKTLALTSLEEEISLDEVNRVLAQFDIEPQVADHALPLDVSLREARDAFERVYFRHHINKERGNMSRIA